VDPSVSTPQGPDPSNRRRHAGRSARRTTSDKAVAEALGAAVELREGGLRVDRRFTKAGIHPFDEVTWEKRSATIANEKGETVFEQKDCEVPSFWSQMATNVVVSKYFRGAQGTPRRETSVKQVISRVADTIAQWGRAGGYFASEADAQAFQDELIHLILHQKMSFNSPVWFNLGVTGSRPQLSACFIQSVDDTMESILTLARNEGMLFKYGSGTGTNLSAIRSSVESLAGGGTASGPVSFMKGFDAFAGVIKSGGTTRRAAKMVILNADHPDVEDFITCKVSEEKKAWTLIEGGYESSFTGEAYASVFFQNSNNSVRVTDEFMRAVEEDRDWHLRAVTDPNRIIKTLKARELMRLMAESAWQCGDPGIQYDTTINDWHTSSNSGRINASNPCFPGDARVHTTAGLIPFAELFDRAAAGETFKVYTHRATAPEPSEGVVVSQPLAIMRNGVKRIVKLTFSNGQRLRCTPNHRLWTLNRGYVAARNLTEGDAVLVNDSATPATEAGRLLPAKVEEPALSWNRGGTKTRRVLPDRWSEELGELAGHLIGDGCMTSSATVWVYGGDDVADGTTDRHERYVRDLVGGVSRKTMANGTVQLTVGTAAWRSLMSGIGVTTSRAHAKRIPEAVFTSPVATQAAFLRGLFGADGCISLVEDGKASRYVGLGSRSYELLLDVQHMLSGFGIRSRVYRVSGRDGQTRFTYVRKTGERVEYLSRRGFDLRITGSDLEVFAQEIGFSTPRKHYALVNLLETTGRYQTKPSVSLLSREDDGEEMVYNLTEPLHHSYIVDGFVVANCSEYMFLDDTSCNLASINVTRFTNDDGSFDIEAYRHAIHITITAQEILVSNASYPTEKIARNSEDYRPLGLGYANLGALLMARGVPYDSAQGRDLAACLTSILTGEAYAQSARIARDIGPFNGYAANRRPMLRVVGKHREAAYNIPADNVEGELVAAARHAWDEAHELGARHGYRNSQATVIAPTGTISFMLDCDTTGVEPDIALVKYKKLVGGGMLKMVNQTVPSALRRLGYGDTAIADIVAYIDAHDTIEGAPQLRDEDLAVFDCAFTPQNGTRSIDWRGHLRMMGAVQPFVSGAISKTINMPNESAVEDVEQAYVDGWKLGLKAVAIYRDGSKRSQPLATSIAKTTGQRAQIVERPLRKRLPAERTALTHKFEVGGHEGYITVGLYDDGSPGEIFLRMAKEGSTVSGLMDSFATAVSLALQYGVPLPALVDKFSHTRFDPQGFTRNPEIPIAKSVMDYIFRWLASRFLSSDDQDRLGIIRRDENGNAIEAAQPTAQPATASAPAPPSAQAPTPTATFVNQEDAPTCSECGSLMVRNGACYKCFNCGATSGCS
jgi:ribonucleoside-diphosphate reductase alpha chain